VCHRGRAPALLSSRTPSNLAAVSAPRPPAPPGSRPRHLPRGNTSRRSDDREQCKAGVAIAPAKAGYSELHDPERCATNGLSACHERGVILAIRRGMLMGLPADAVSAERFASATRERRFR